MSARATIAELADLETKVRDAKRRYDEKMPGYPRSHKDFDAYGKARTAAEDKLLEELTALGAALRKRPPHDHAIRLAGIRSSSTSGYAGAVSNWVTAARKRLEKGGDA